MKRLKRNEKGFTLIEMIVVIVIIAVLVALAVPRVLSYIEDARDSKFLAEARKVFTEVQLLSVDTISEVGVFENSSSSTEKEIQKAVLEKYPLSTTEKPSTNPVVVGNYEMHPAMLTLHFDNQAGGWKLDKTTTNHNVTKMGIVFYDKTSKTYALVVFKSNGDARVFKENPYASGGETSNSSSEWYVDWISSQK